MCHLEGWAFWILVCWNLHCPRGDAMIQDVFLKLEAELYCFVCPRSWSISFKLWALLHWSIQIGLPQYYKLLELQVITKECVLNVDPEVLCQTSSGCKFWFFGSFWKTHWETHLPYLCNEECMMVLIHRMWDLQKFPCNSKYCWCSTNSICHLVIEARTPRKFLIHWITTLLWNALMWYSVMVHSQLQDTPIIYDSLCGTDFSPLWHSAMGLWSSSNTAFCSQLAIQRTTGRF